MGGGKSARKAVLALNSSYIQVPEKKLAAIFRRKSDKFQDGFFCERDFSPNCGKPKQKYNARKRPDHEGREAGSGGGEGSLEAGGV